MRRVFAPKADGAWFLHKHTQEDELEAFVLFSSLSALVGAVGQCNYSAANAYLDELACWRSSNGLPSRCIQWPGVAGIGMAAAVKLESRLPTSYCISDSDCSMILRCVFHGLKFNACENPVIAAIPSAIYHHWADQSTRTHSALSVSLKIFLIIGIMSDCCSN